MWETKSPGYDAYILGKSWEEIARKYYRKSLQLGQDLANLRTRLYAAWFLATVEFISLLILAWMLWPK